MTDWILDTLALLPWWGWLIVFLPVLRVTGALLDRIDMDTLERLGLREDDDRRGYLYLALFAVYVVFALYAEGNLR